MLVINRQKKHGVNFREIWFAEEKSELDGIILYRGAKEPIGNMLRRVRTLVTDLRKTPEELMSACQKDCKYQIRRAEREGISASFLCGKDITATDINDFLEFFMEFWTTKGGAQETYEKYKEEIETYVREGVFAITKAITDEKTLVYHTYIVGDDFVRSYQSASLFRQDKAEARTVSYANRYLHMQDMLYFKNAGKSTYDWGGAGLSDEVKAITEFKASFGGEELYYYDCEDLVGTMAHAVKGLINLIGMISDD